MPYCTKCGKKIDSDESLCEDCRNAELLFDTSKQAESNQNDNSGNTDNRFENENVEKINFSTPDDKGSRMDGFNRALASAIVSQAVFSIVELTNLIFVVRQVVANGVGNVIGFLLSSLPFMVALVFSIRNGILSIKLFINNKNAGKVKPVSTLVLGIIACVMSATTIVYFLASLITVLALV